MQVILKSALFVSLAATLFLIFFHYLSLDFAKKFKHQNEALISFTAETAVAHGKRI